MHIGRLQGSTKAYRSDSAVTSSESGPTCISTASGYRRKSTDPRWPRCSIGTSKTYTSVYLYTSIYLYVLRVGTKYPPGLAGTFMVGSRLSATLTRARLQKAVISCRHRKPSAVIATHKRDPATNATQAGEGGNDPYELPYHHPVPIEILPTPPRKPSNVGLFGRGRRRRSMVCPSLTIGLMSA